MVTIVRKVELVPPESAETGSLSALKSVLIYDGDWTEGGKIRNCLEACGYETTVWNSFDDAKKSLSDRDWNMVVISTNLGADYDRILAELRPKKTPPKVIIIADEDEGDATARCFLQFVAVLNRPYKLGELADLTQHLIGEP